MKALLPLPLVFLSACGAEAPAESSAMAAAPSTEGGPGEQVKLDPIERGFWSASLISPDGAPAGMVARDGKRTLSWEVRVGEGIEFLTFGFLGSGSGKIGRAHV